MVPTLRRGDRVSADPAVEPRPGDVVLLDASGWLEIHRLMARVRAGRTAWYVHMGDASDACGLACREEILGVIPVPGRRPRPAAWAHALGLVLRLGAFLLEFGVVPGRRAARLLARAFKGAAGWMPAWGRAPEGPPDGGESPGTLFVERIRNSG